MFQKMMGKEGGTEGQCGWLKDKFGVSWQIVPTVLSKYLSDKDAKKSQRVMQAVLRMKKLNIAELEKSIKELSAYKTSGKGTVQFPLDKPVPLSLIRKIVKYRMKESAADWKKGKKKKKIS